MFMETIRIHGTIPARGAKRLGASESTGATGDNTIGDNSVAASNGAAKSEPTSSTNGRNVPTKTNATARPSEKFLVYFALSACWGRGEGGGTSSDIATIAGHDGAKCAGVKYVTGKEAQTLKGATRGGARRSVGGGAGIGKGIGGNGGIGNGGICGRAGETKVAGAGTGAGAGAGTGAGTGGRGGRAGGGGINVGGDASFGKQQAETLIAYMHSNGIRRLFLVTGSPVTPPAQKLLENALRVEYWPVTACLSSAESHQCVPKCRKLAPREKKAFYAQNGLSATNLPRMLVSDRMCKYWDFVPGDVVELERNTHVGVVKGEMRVVTYS